MALPGKCLRRDGLYGNWKVILTEFWLWWRAQIRKLYEAMNLQFTPFSFENEFFTLYVLVGRPLDQCLYFCPNSKHTHFANRPNKSANVMQVLW